MLIKLLKNELNKTYVPYKVGKYKESQSLLQPVTSFLNKKLINLFINLQCQARALISKFIFNYLFSQLLLSFISYYLIFIAYCISKLSNFS